MSAQPSQTVKSLKKHGSFHLGNERPKVIHMVAAVG